MPTYDYTCDACGHAFEQFQSITAPVLKKCPQCGKLKLRRLIGTGAAILFKGSGFWQTDYRSESYKQGEKADKPASDAAPAKAESSPSKPEAKAPATTKPEAPKPDQAKPNAAKPEATPKNPSAPKPSEKSPKKTKE